MKTGVRMLIAVTMGTVGFAVGCARGAIDSGSGFTERIGATRTPETTTPTCPPPHLPALGVYEVVESSDPDIVEASITLTAETATVDYLLTSGQAWTVVWTVVD